MYSYKIEEVGNRLTVNFFVDDMPLPFHTQQTYPNGTLFTTVQDTKIWADYAIASMSDVSAPLAPNGPGEDPQFPPTNEERGAIIMEFDQERQNQ